MQKRLRVSLSVLVSILACGVSAPLAFAATAPSLGTAANFAALGTAVTLTTSVVTGDVGSTGVAVINTGSTVNGTIHAGAAPAVTGAYADFQSAYVAVNAMTVGSTTTGALAGMILTPGVYSFDATAKTGTLTLDAQGNPNAVWIVKGTGALTATNFNVVFLGGVGSSSNVFWWTPATAGATLTTSTIVGTILSGAAITVTGVAGSPGANVLSGRALATDAVTITNNTVTAPVVAPSTPPTLEVYQTTLGSPSGNPQGNVFVSGSAAPFLAARDAAIAGTLTSSTTYTSVDASVWGPGGAFGSELYMFSVVKNIPAGSLLRVTKSGVVKDSDNPGGIPVFSNDIYYPMTAYTHITSTTAIDHLTQFDCAATVCTFVTGASQAVDYSGPPPLGSAGIPPVEIANTIGLQFQHTIDVQVITGNWVLTGGTTNPRGYQQGTGFTGGNAPLDLGTLVNTSSVPQPATVFVDPAYTTVSCGGHECYYDAFPTMQDAVSAVATGGTINVVTGAFTITPTVLGNEASTTLPVAVKQTSSDNSVTVTAEIPAGTVVTGNASWDGAISAPTSAPTTVVTVPGFDTPVTSAITVGSTLSDLVFDKAVKLTFAGQAGTLVGSYNHAGTFATIVACGAGSHDQVWADDVANLAVGSACTFDLGPDLIVWTKHFSTFVTYTQTATPSAPAPTPAQVVNGSIAFSGGGGGGGSANPLPGATAATGVPTTTIIPGLPQTGAVSSVTNVYSFTRNLGVGSRGADVTALQRYLIDNSFSLPSGATGYFGAQTKAAVIAFQKARGIAQVGNVGPSTRAELNSGTMTSTVAGGKTNLTASQAHAILSIVESFGADASVVAKVKASLGL